MKELRDKAEKHEFQAEVNRMMKLIINSLYKNKEIFFWRLINHDSNARWWHFYTALPPSSSRQAEF